jgi:hypothetical protein
MKQNKQNADTNSSKTTTKRNGKGKATKATTTTAKVETPEITEEITAAAAEATTNEPTEREQLAFDMQIDAQNFSNLINRIFGEFKEELNTPRAIIRALCASEIADAQRLRDILGLTAESNAAARDAAARMLESAYPYFELRPIGDGHRVFCLSPDKNGRLDEAPTAIEAARLAIMNIVKRSADRRLFLLGNPDRAALETHDSDWSTANHREARCGDYIVTYGPEKGRLLTESEEKDRAEMAEAKKANAEVKKADAHARAAVRWLADFAANEKAAAVKKQVLQLLDVLEKRGIQA